MVYVICSLWLLQGCVEAGSGYFYPKPKYSLEIKPSIELISKSLTYEESPVTETHQNNLYQGLNYAQQYMTAPITKNHYQGVHYVRSPTKPERHHNNYQPLIQQSSVQSNHKTTNGYIYAPKSVHGNQLIMDMGEYKISIPISSDGVVADGEYLVKIPIYQKVTKK